MSNISDWAWNHVVETRSGEVADLDAALVDAKASEEWEEFGPIVEYRGWTATINDAKRRKKTGVLYDLVERCGGQTVFSFVDGLVNTSRGLLFAEDVVLNEFDEVTRRQESGINADMLRNNQRRAVRDMLAHIWEPKPELKFGDVLSLYAEEIEVGESAP